MTFSYYPGCTLRTKAKDLNNYGIEAAKALGVNLEEVPNWQCCGGVYPIAKDEIATKLSSVRALSLAYDLGNDLVTMCSACHHVLKRVNKDMRENEDIRERANNYLQLEHQYGGETNVIHYLEMLRDRIGFDKIKEKVTNPLKGRKIAAYYGCLLLRPAKDMQFDNPENPTIMEDFIKALGATPVVFPLRNECCGGYMTVENKEVAIKRSEKVLSSAKDMGATEIITACPLCLYNLKNNGNSDIPVLYFTELLAEALGLK